MVSSVQLGERIAAARKRAALTQADLAGKLGLARTTLVAMEKGERPPANDELVRLAAALSIELHDLLREHAVIAQVSPRFRAGDKHADAEAAVRELTKLAEQYAELEQALGIARAPAPLEAMTSFRALPLASASAARIAGQDAASSLRRIFGLGDGPALSLQATLELEAGLRVFLLEMPGSISAVLIWSDQIGACVALNRDQSAEEQRRSLMHELGHFLRDREAGDVLLSASRKQSPIEVFCEALTSEFLLPAAGVRRRFSEHLREKGRQHFSAADLLALARFYEVSLEAMTRRLEELQLLPSRTYDGLRRKNAKANEAVSPYGAAMKPMSCLPQRYRRLAFEAFAQSAISESELARFLHTDRIDARREHLNWISELDELEIDPGASMLDEATAG
jgi:Zn-dependent peptidase ImmA (M78 family)/transcriptional regulator with XRE-family HTH domain